jgi:hypothetical protein
MTPVETLREAARLIRADWQDDDWSDVWSPRWLAVADWLESVARMRGENLDQRLALNAALAAARIYLGEA